MAKKLNVNKRGRRSRGEREENDDDDDVVHYNPRHAQLRPSTFPAEIERDGVERDGAEWNRSLYLGAEFSSFDDLNRAVDEFSQRHHVTLYRAESRTIENVRKQGRRKGIDEAPSALVYCALSYACKFGGKKFRSKNTGLRPAKGTQKQNCPFSIHVVLSKDCQRLVVSKMSSMADHNHAVLCDSKKSSSADVAERKQPNVPSSNRAVDTSSSRVINGKYTKRSTLNVAPNTGSNSCRTDIQNCGVVADQDSFLISDRLTSAESQMKDVFVNGVGPGCVYVGMSATVGTDIGDIQSQLIATASTEASGDHACNDSSSHGNDLLETLLSFQRRSLFCDTLLMTMDSGSVFAHSAVLAAVCPSLLTALNQKPFSVYQPNVIDVSQFSVDVVTKLVEFFYTGRLPCAEDRLQLDELFAMLGVSFKSDANATSAGSVVTETAGFEECSEDKCEEEHELTDTVVRVVHDSLQQSSFTDVALLSGVEDIELKEEIDCKPEIDFDMYGSQDTWTLLEGCELVMLGERTKPLSEVRVTTRSKSFKRPRITSGLLHAGTREASFEDWSVKDQSVGKSSGTTVYPCEFCEKQFTTQLRLDRHKWSHYTTSNGAYQCKICAKVCEFRSQLRVHVRTHTASKAKRHMCSICGHCFINKRRLKSHINTHTNARPNMCDVCGMCFNDVEYLTKHKRRHRGDKRYECKVCGKRFYTSSANSAHLRTHTGERPYECTLCGARFTAATSLKFHMLGHDGVRPFPCTICCKTFRRPARLRQHVLNMHTENSAKPFACEICGRAFSLNSYLKQHMLVHCKGDNKRKKKMTTKQERVEVMESVIPFEHDVCLTIDEVQT